MGRRRNGGLGTPALLSPAGCTTPPGAVGRDPHQMAAARGARRTSPARPLCSPSSARTRRTRGCDAWRPRARCGRCAGSRRRHHVHYEQLRGLLGNDAVIGLPHVGAAPLAVLTTRDGDALDAFAQARAFAGRATRAGRYRGSDLYAERGWAFGVRDRVLLVGRWCCRRRSATCVPDHAFDVGGSTRPAALPETQPPAAFAHGYVDLRPLVGRAVRVQAGLRAGVGAQHGRVLARRVGGRAARDAGGRPVGTPGLTAVHLPLLTPARPGRGRRCRRACPRWLSPS